MMRLIGAYMEKVLLGLVVLQGVIGDGVKGVHLVK